MLILSLDSASSTCGVCVWSDGALLAEAEEAMERGQDQRLIPLMLAVMEKADIDFPQLDRIAVTTGPGSFTGLRIGLAAARGIGFVAKKPVIGIDRFTIFHRDVKHSDALVVIASKRKELYCRFYPLSGTAEEPSMMTPDEIAAFLKGKKTTVIGDADIPGLQKASAKETILCAALAAEADQNDPLFLPRPLYVRPPDVTIKPSVTERCVG